MGAPGCLLVLSSPDRSQRCSMIVEGFGFTGGFLDRSEYWAYLQDRKYRLWEQGLGEGGQRS